MSKRKIRKQHPFATNRTRIGGCIQVAEANMTSDNLLNLAHAAEELARKARKMAKTQKDLEASQAFGKAIASFDQAIKDHEWTQAATAIKTAQSLSPSFEAKGMNSELEEAIRSWLDNSISFTTLQETNRVLIVVQTNAGYPIVEVGYTEFSTEPNVPEKKPEAHIQLTTDPHRHAFEFEPSRVHAPYRIVVTIRGESLPTITRVKMLDSEKIPDNAATVMAAVE